MNRRNFLGLAPVGLAGMAALARGQEPEAKTEVKKAKNITIMGPNGEHYHPLVVEAEETQYANVEPKKAITCYGTERARITSNGAMQFNSVMSIDNNGYLGLGPTTTGYNK